MSSDKQRLIRFGIIIATTLISTVYYFIQGENEQQLLNNMFHNSVFGMEGVTTQLAYYEERETGVFIRIESSGLPDNATSYKPSLLAFICSKPFFKEKLVSGKSINLDMAAYDREEGNHVNMKINKGRCSYDF